MTDTPRLWLWATRLALLLSLAGCKPPPAPAGAEGPRPTLDELVAQLEGGPCVWLRDRRYPSGAAPRVIRHPAHQCRIAAARAIGDLDAGGAPATAVLVRVADEVQDVDTGDGWLMVRTSVLYALARVADDPAAIPTLVDATRTTRHEIGRLAAARAVALGHEPALDLDRAAAAAADPASRERLQAMRQLWAHDDPRGVTALSAWLRSDAPLDRGVLRLADEVIHTGSAPILEAAAAACARYGPPHVPWEMERLCRRFANEAD